MEPRTTPATPLRHARSGPLLDALALHLGAPLAGLAAGALLFLAAHVAMPAHSRALCLGGVALLGALATLAILRSARAPADPIPRPWEPGRRNPP